MNYLKLFQDARIESIELIGKDELYIIYNDSLCKSEIKDLEKTYKVIFVNSRCCILSCYHEDEEA